MKKSLLILLLLVSIKSTLEASTRSDVKMIEASEKIRISSERLAKEYLFYTMYQHKSEYRKKIETEVEIFEKSVRDIAFMTKHPKVKRLLEFFAYEKEQLKQYVKDVTDKDSTLTVLDSSDAITEGAVNIGKLIAYDFSFEEKMLMSIKKIEFLFEKASKYYLVLDMDIDKATFRKKMDELIVEIDDELEAIKEYEYPDKHKQMKSDIFLFWGFVKEYYSNDKSQRLPNIILISQNGIKDILNKIAEYHSSNQ